MTRRLLAVLVLASVASLGALVACGGDDSSDTSSDAPTSTTPSGFSGRDSEAFCKLARSYTAQIREVGANVSNPAALKNVLAEVEPAVREAVSKAPDEIKSDIQYLANAFKEIRDALESGSQINLSTLTDPQFQTSATRLTAYGREVCGIAP